MYNYVHFIGIGGIGMSAIAQLFLRKGVKVSGSDVKDSQIIQSLRKLGARVKIGHNAKNLSGQDLVVYSSAIRKDNPELKKAKAQGLRLIKRAQALAELMGEQTLITVTGAHGKTTTACLIAHILLEAGFSPSVAIGGISLNWENNAYLGDGEFFVIEADESDGSFLYYRPDYSIITNIDYEHMDYYKSFGNLKKSFKGFLENTKENGCVFACVDDKRLKSLLNGYRKKSVSFGLSEGAAVRARRIEIKGLSSQFDCFYKRKPLGRFKIILGGEHNISNSLAAVALALELGIDLELVKKALSTYLGTERRMQIMLKAKDILVIDDYAHHPTEIKTTLAAVKNLGHRRLIVVFQPHRYTRTNLLMDQLARSFTLADQLIITDIYPAGEEPIKGVDALKLCERLEKIGQKGIKFVPKAKISEFVLSLIEPKDIVLMLGAGDINRVSEELVGLIKKEWKG